MKQSQIRAKKIAMIALILGLLTSIVYAGKSTFVDPNEQNNFFQVDKKEATPGQTVTMTLDLSKIDYNQFIFTLSSTTTMTNVQAQEEIQDNIQIQKDKNNLKLQANKKELSMSSITFSYVIPENVAIGSRITLKATIMPQDESEKSENVVSNNMENMTVDLQNTIEEVVPTSKQQVEVTIDIVEKKKEEENQNQIQNVEEEKKPEGQNNLNNDKNTPVQSQRPQATSKTTSSMTSGQNKEVVTYEGSYDNYLEKITVDGFTITPEFSKTNQTYFVTVANDIEQVAVNVEKSDNSASVQIYGNTNLQVGENKVIISVTAENGNVRHYRIYVTREA